MARERHTLGFLVSVCWSCRAAKGSRWESFLTFDPALSPHEAVHAATFHHRSVLSWVVLLPDVRRLRILFCSGGVLNNSLDSLSSVPSNCFATTAFAGLPKLLETS